MSSLKIKQKVPTKTSIIVFPYKHNFWYIQNTARPFFFSPTTNWWEKRLVCVSDDEEDDDVRAKMLTWLLFHISEEGKKDPTFTKEWTRWKQIQ